MEHYHINPEAFKWVQERREYMKGQDFSMLLIAALLTLAGIFLWLKTHPW